eukprot:365664-Chlamydomonas_euryale.AAC.1
MVWAALHVLAEPSRPHYPHLPLAEQPANLSPPYTVHTPAACRAACKALAHPTQSTHQPLAEQPLSECSHTCATGAQAAAATADADAANVAADASSAATAAAADVATAATDDDAGVRNVHAAYRSILLAVVPAQRLLTRRGRQPGRVGGSLGEACGMHGQIGASTGEDLGALRGAVSAGSPVAVVCVAALRGSPEQRSVGDGGRSQPGGAARCGRARRPRAVAVARSHSRRECANAAAAAVSPASAVSANAATDHATANAAACAATAATYARKEALDADNFVGLVVSATAAFAVSVAATRWRRLQHRRAQRAVARRCARRRGRWRGAAGATAPALSGCRAAGSNSCSSGGGAATIGTLLVLVLLLLLLVLPV